MQDVEKDTKVEVQSEEKKDDGGCLAVLGALMLAPFVLVTDSLIFGYVLYQLWDWFLVTLGVPTISIVHALGLSLTIQMFVTGIKIDKEKIRKEREKQKKMTLNQTVSDFLETFALKIISGLLILLIGYIIHRFM